MELRQHLKIPPREVVMVLVVVTTFLRKRGVASELPSPSRSSSVLIKEGVRDISSLSMTSSGAALLMRAVEAWSSMAFLPWPSFGGQV